MKKYLIATTVLLTLTAAPSSTAWAQKNVQQQELVDSTKTDELTAYSDTTATAAADEDTTLVSSSHRVGGSFGGWQNVWHDSDSFTDLIRNHLLVDGFAGMMIAAVVLLFLFLLLPVVILALLFFLIYKNRKQKMKLAEMAMQQGQPIPDQLFVEHKETDDELWQKGLRQTFLGVGLLAFFGYLDSTVGIGIGILVTVIGLGKLVIVKTGRKN